MFRPFIEKRPGAGREGRSPQTRILRLAGCLLLVGCAAAKPAATAQRETVRSHVYPLPLDNVLAQTTTLMQRKGWGVKRVSNALVTNWQGSGEALVTYRIYGQRIDAGLCAILVERLVATRSTSFNLDHPFTETDRDGAVPFIYNVNPHFVDDAANDSAGGTPPPPGAFSPVDVSRPSPWIVTLHERDAALELELRREIDPTPMSTGGSSEQPSGTRATEAFADSARPPSPRGPETTARGEGEARNRETASPGAERRVADLAGIWEGTFNFKGNVIGSFAGEVTVAVDGESVEVDDFCPDSGATLKATGSGEAAAWQGELDCPPIGVKGCSASIIRYNSARATVKDSTLVLVAAGNVETPAGCSYSSGALSVAFIAQKADYVHIAVTRVKRTTSCVWPTDWEDFTSPGSMSMPETAQDDAAYLGIIRAKGSRLTEIQQLLRHCHQLVLLHGQPVVMKLTATRSHHDELH